MLQNQINGEIEMAKVYYNEEYVILVFSVSENMLSLANINPKDYCKTLFDLKRRDSKAIQCNSKHTKQYKT